MTNELVFSSVLAAAFVLGSAVVVLAQHGHDAPAGKPTAPFEIPQALRVEHEELHSELSALTALPGKTGEAAKRVAALLHPHFVSEEEFALPPLGLLVPLANGKASPDMRAVIPLTDRLKADMPRMLDEHKAIVGALGELKTAGKAESHPDAIEFADKLVLHAQNEEQVLYPAALLVGEYARLKLPK